MCESNTEEKKNSIDAYTNLNQEGKTQIMGNLLSNIQSNVTNSHMDIKTSLSKNPYEEDQSGWTPLIQTCLIYLLVITFLTLIMTVPPLDLVVTVSAPKTVLTAANNHHFSGLISDSHQANRFVLTYHNDTKNSTNILYDVKFDGHDKIKNGVDAFNIITDTSLSPHSSYDGVMLATKQRPFHSTVYEADEEGEMNEEFLLSNMDMVNNAGPLVSNVVPMHMLRVGDGVYLSQVAQDSSVNCVNGESEANIENTMLSIQLNQDEHQSLQVASITHMNNVLSYTFPTSNDKNNIIAFILYQNAVNKCEYVDNQWSIAYSVTIDNTVGDNASMTAIDKNRVVITSNAGITIADFQRNSTSNHTMNNNVNHTNTLIFEQDDGSVYVICVIDHILCVFNEEMNLLQQQRGHFSNIYQRRIGSYTDGPEHYVYFVDSGDKAHVKCVLVRSVS